MKEWKKGLLILAVFITVYFIPFANDKINNALLAALLMLQEYAREHVLFCLIPAFFIAGGVSVFISKNAVINYFGAKANKILSYTIASVSGTILSVCSCTVLPLFSGIYKRGAGIGPATAFLYSGPAINIMAIILTARVLGFQLGLARAVGAIIFSIIIGLLMHLIFIKDERARIENKSDLINMEKDKHKSLFKYAIYFFSMIAILVFLNWMKDENIVFWNLIYSYKYYITGFFTVILFLVLIFWFSRKEIEEWINSTKGFALQILPLLFAGVLIAGFLLGKPELPGIIPNEWIARLVGGNSISSNFIASIAGAFMYFATLTEIPILEGLIGSGMGKGPSLALLLSGPALSLPNMLVIRSVLGNKKTSVYIFLVVIMATFSGKIFGLITS